MTTRPAGDVDYDHQGGGYALQRRTDPRIADYVHTSLGTSRTVLNVGAGAGSYEPLDRQVIAVEPSASMRNQRPAHLAPVVDAVSEHLPFGDNTFDAAMATVTIHQWADVERGLREMRRVSTGPVVLLTFDGDALDRFWLADYVPELMAAERGRYPAIARVQHILGSDTTVTSIPVPADCVDGFTEAYYARPERLLEPEVRRSQSAWNFVDAAVAQRAMQELRADLASGEWDRRYGSLRHAPTFVGSLRLVTALPT